MSLSDFLSGAGVLIAAACACASILLPAGRVRSAAMLTALVLFPILILGDQWHNHQIVELRHHEAKAAVAVIVSAAVNASATAAHTGSPSARLSSTRITLYSARRTAASAARR